MRFQCLGCGKPFGWTAKKTVSKMIEGYELPVTMEYIVCPYCEGFDFEEVNGTLQKKKKETPPMQPLAPATKSLPEFNPADLIEHKWKGRKQGDKNYAAGSLEYGWDFADQFKPATIKALEKGELTVDKYVFRFTGKIVQTKKVK